MEPRRPLSEAECYARCYGWRGGEETVKVLRPSHSEPDGESNLLLEPSEAGERLRRLLELRLDAREPEAA